MRLHRWIQTVPLALVLVAGGAQVSTAPAVRQAAATADRIALSQPERVGFSSESLK